MHSSRRIVFGLEIDGSDKLSGRANENDLFGIDLSQLGQVSVYGVRSGTASQFLAEV